MEGNLYRERGGGQHTVFPTLCGKAENYYVCTVGLDIFTVLPTLLAYLISAEAVHTCPI